MISDQQVVGSNPGGANVFPVLLVLGPPLKVMFLVQRLAKNHYQSQCFFHCIEILLTGNKGQALSR